VLNGILWNGVEIGPDTGRIGIRKATPSMVF
jgi:hypothetical protein